MTRAFLLLLALLASPALAAPAVVIDGDTIVLDGQHWRLCGINAPERSDPGGAAATAYMRSLVDGRDVACEVACNRRDHDRKVGFCRVDGKDLGRLMIDAGHACRWARFDKAGVYAGEPECRK